MKYAMLWIVLIAGLASCTINRNVMFKTDHDYVFDTPPADTSATVEYRISPNDVIMMQLFSNEGARLLEMTAGAGDQQQIIQFPNSIFLIDNEGNVDLPEIGMVNLKDLTLYEARERLESLYQEFYKGPYVLLEVTNNRVIVFPGSGGEAAVIPLQNNNTTVIEALALAGGVAERGDARRVKLIRYVNDKREIYQMDLSTIEGVRYGSMIVQANDVIYVEPVPEIAREVLKDVNPIITLISGVALIYAIVSGAF
jgi:polysaccharide export outer membrane protein